MRCFGVSQLQRSGAGELHAERHHEEHELRLYLPHHPLPADPVPRAHDPARLAQRAGCVVSQGVGGVRGGRGGGPEAPRGPVGQRGQHFLGVAHQLLVDARRGQAEHHVRETGEREGNSWGMVGEGLNLQGAPQ